MAKHIQGFSGDTEPYGMGGYENTSQGHRDNLDRLESAVVRDSNQLYGSAGPEGRAEPKEWPNCGLDDVDDEKKDKREGAVLTNKHVSSDRVKTGDGFRSESEPTTDSGVPVNSTSDGPTRSFTIRPLHGGT